MGHISIRFSGDSNIGLYGIATDKYAIAGGVYSDARKKIQEALNVPLHDISLLKLDLIKLFMAGNSSHLIIPGFLPKNDMQSVAALAEKLDLKIIKIGTTFAIGNLLLVNDKGVLVSPMLKEHISYIEQHIGLPCSEATIAGLQIIGSAAITTNKGFLAHYNIFDEEAAIVEKILQVPVEVGTVNFGSPYPGSGIIANSHGFAAGSACSGPELGRIAEALGFVEK
jgi:translation initiation factor 6